MVGQVELDDRAAREAWLAEEARRRREEAEAAARRQKALVDAAAARAKAPYVAWGAAVGSGQATEADFQRAQRDRAAAVAAATAARAAEAKKSAYERWGAAVGSGQATEAQFQQALRDRANRAAASTVAQDRAAAAAFGVTPGGSRGVPTEGEKLDRQLRYGAAASNDADFYRGIGFGGVSGSTSPTGAQIRAQQDVTFAQSMGYGSGGASGDFPSETQKGERQAWGAARVAEEKAGLDAARRGSLLEMGVDVNPDMSGRQGAADVEKGIADLSSLLESPYVGVEAALSGAYLTERAAMGLTLKAPSGVDVKRLGALLEMGVDVNPDMSATLGDSFLNALTLAGLLGVEQGVSFALRPKMWADMVGGAAGVYADPGGALDAALKGPLDKTTGERAGPGVLSLGELPFTAASILGGVLGGHLFSKGVGALGDALYGKSIVRETVMSIRAEKVGEVTDLEGVKVNLQTGEFDEFGGKTKSLYRVESEVERVKLPSDFPLQDAPGFDAVMGIGSEGGARGPMMLGVDDVNRLFGKPFVTESLTVKFQGVLGNADDYARFADVGKNTLTGEPNIFKATYRSLDAWKETSVGSLWDDFTDAFPANADEGFSLKVISGVTKAEKLDLTLEGLRSRIAAGLYKGADTTIKPTSASVVREPSTGLWRAFSGQYPEKIEQIKGVDAISGGKGSAGYAKAISGNVVRESVDDVLKALVVGSESEAALVSGGKALSRVVYAPLASSAGFVSVGGASSFSQLMKPKTDLATGFRVSVGLDAFLGSVADVSAKPASVVDLKPISIVDLKPASMVDLKPVSVVDIKPISVVDIKPITIIIPIITPITTQRQRTPPVQEERQKEKTPGPFFPPYVPPGPTKPRKTSPLGLEKGFRGLSFRLRKNIVSVKVPDAEEVLAAVRGKRRRGK